MGVVRPGCKDKPEKNQGRKGKCISSCEHKASSSSADTWETFCTAATLALPLVPPTAEPRSLIGQRSAPPRLLLLAGGRVNHRADSAERGMTIDRFLRPRRGIQCQGRQSETENRLRRLKERGKPSPENAFSRDWRNSPYTDTLNFHKLGLCPTSLRAKIVCAWERSHSAAAGTCGACVALSGWVHGGGGGAAVQPGGHQQRRGEREVSFWERSEGGRQS